MTTAVANHRDDAVAAFDERLHRTDGGQVADSLVAGLDLLRDAFYTRIHRDVERQYGADSLIDPQSMVRTEALIKAEVLAFEIAEAATAAEDAAYVSVDHGWFANWLARLYLGRGAEEGPIAERLKAYSLQPAGPRRLRFNTAIERLLPESARAPLVMYRLFPLAITIVTALAFGDQPRAATARRQQHNLLMSIGDCPQCRGALLPNGETCRECGNPFWKFAWLTAD